MCVVVKCVGGHNLCREVQLYAFLPGLGHSVEGCLELVVLYERSPDSASLGFHEGVNHAAADDHVVGQIEQVLYDSEFGGDFGSAEDDGQGTLGIAQNLVNRLDLTLHHVAEHLVVGKILGDEGRGCVGAVGRSECVVDVAVGVGCQVLGEFLLAFLHCGLCGFLLLFGGVLGQSAGLALLLGVETQILKQEHLAGLQGRGLLIGLHAVGSELHLSAQQLLYAADDVPEGEFVSGPLRLSEMGHYYKGTSASQYLLQGGDGGADTCVVGDVEIRVEGDIEIHSHNGLFATEVIRVYVLHNLKN